MEPTHERMTPEMSDPLIEAEHWERYRFVTNFIKDRKVADIACGSGYGSRFLRDSGAKEVTGGDISRDAIEFAIHKYARDGVDFRELNAENLESIPSESFDIVTSFETIEHLSNVDSYLKEMNRILKPGGRYFVSTPDRRIASALHPFTKRPHNQFHQIEYSRSEFIKLVSTYFKVVGVFGQGYCNKFLALLPIQLLIKGSAKLLKLKFLKQIKHSIYDSPHKIGVTPANNHPFSIAKYWVLECTKLEPVESIE
jgi:ubiquinone/menaquinone biosynthesis C-methylase UbiE